jgi:hypothetical protein
MTSEKFLGLCSDAKRDLDIVTECCLSCHDDVEYGYFTEMFDLETIRGWYKVCCRVICEYEGSLLSTSSPGEAFSDDGIGGDQG